VWVDWNANQVYDGKKQPKSCTTLSPIVLADSELVGDWSGSPKAVSDYTISGPALL